MTWQGGNISSPTRRVPIPGKQVSVKPSDKVRSDFKGHKVDRVAKDREAETQSRLDGMEKRIEDWRQVSRSGCAAFEGQSLRLNVSLSQARKDTKQNAKPALPF